MNVHDAHGGPELCEHHSCVAFDIPIDSRTYFPNGLSSPFTSSGLIEFRRERAAVSWSVGGWFIPPG
jgi:hypothetical protein